MKILDVKSIRQLEEHSVTDGMFSYKELMHSAAFSFFKRLKEVINSRTISTIHIISGGGNNGGDGIVISDYLSTLSVYNINLVLLDCFSKKSSLNIDVLKENILNKRINIYSAEKQSEIPKINKKDLVIDAIFGCGLNRQLDSNMIGIIQRINASCCQIISVDIPSGLYGDILNDEDDSIIESSEIITFHSIKKSMLYEENLHYLRSTNVVEIGLPDTPPSPHNWDLFITKAHPFTDINSRSLHTYKNKQGKLMVVGGAKDMHGAPLLSAEAALRTGCGYSYIQSCEYVINLCTNTSLMTKITNKGDYITQIFQEYKMIYALGPGLGQNENTISALSHFLKNQSAPMVLDADAISIIGINNLHKYIPPMSILTPHIGEFKSLVNKDWVNGEQKLDLLRKISIDLKCIIVLKGPYTAICDETGKIYFNSTGNSSLAVAGSGDVLTGMIGSFLAQGYSSLEAAVKGVFYHGLAADLYIENSYEGSLTPLSLLEYVEKALILES